MYTHTNDGRIIRVHRYGEANYGWAILMWSEEVGVWLVQDERAGYKTEFSAMEAGLMRAEDKR